MTNNEITRMLCLWCETVRTCVNMDPQVFEVGESSHILIDTTISACSSCRYKYNLASIKPSMLRVVDLVLLRRLLDKTIMIANSFWPCYGGVHTKLWRNVDAQTNQVEKVTQFKSKETPINMVLTKAVNRIPTINMSTEKSVTEAMKMIEDTDRTPA